MSSENEGWNKTLNQLNTILADLYPNQSSIPRIATHSGIPCSQINFNDPPEDVWFNVILEAKKHEKILDLVRLVRGKYPTKTQLEQIERDLIHPLSVYPRQPDTRSSKASEIPESSEKLCEEVDDQAESKKRLEWAQGEITALLKKSPELALKRLRDSLGLGSVDMEQQHITERLLKERSLQERLNLLNKLRVEFQKQKEHQSLKCIKDLLNILLPAVFNHRLIAQMRNQKNSFAPFVPDPQIATETAAEIIMAGVDDRSTIFKPLQQEYELPEGEFNHCKELSPESGFQRNYKESYIQNFHTHMTNTFAPGQKSQTIAALRVKHLATRNYGEYDEKQTQYYTFKMPNNSDDKTLFIEVIKELQRKYPYLMFINLDQDDNKYSDEFEQMFRVGDMLYVNKNQENTS